MHEMSINVQNVVKNTQVQASSVAETSASIDQMVTSFSASPIPAKVLLDIANRSREEVVSRHSDHGKDHDGLNRTTRPFSRQPKSSTSSATAPMTSEKL